MNSSTKLTSALRALDRLDSPCPIESLEPRIAPASVSVAYTDFDGDIVKVIATKPGLTAPPLDSTDLLFVDGTTDGQLKTLNLTEAGFDGASITFKVARKAGGNGFADVGFINAAGVDLNKVVVKGDLGKVIAGDSITTRDGGLNLLKVASMGGRGLSSQGGTGDLHSIVTGLLGALTVAGDFIDARLEALATIPSDGQIGSISVGGDLAGSSGIFSGQIHTSGATGDIRIGGSVIGGGGDSSGQVFSEGPIGKVWVGGDIVGGGGDVAGQIGTLGAMGDVRVKGDIVGGTILGAGGVVSRGAMGNVRIDGDVVGGTAEATGFVSGGEIGDVRIGGSLKGGYIYSYGTMGNVRVDGTFSEGSSIQCAEEN
ncbi:MAG TPA: hypothetical protein VFG14_17845 [Chthoniobacteraceae bacterium]|nr:hypothetical protein [Chthoniobacteraceae bacterium]